MTRKQFGIIFTLMALIVCVGVLATKLNTNGMTDLTDLSLVLSNGENTTKTDNNEVAEKDDEAQTSTSQDYFFATRSEIEQNDARTVTDLKNIINDANTSQDKKDIATNELTQKTMIKDQQGRVETNIRNNGYEDALCFIEDSKVRVIVKATDSLTAEENAVIQEIVHDVTKISDVIIEVKK